MSRLCDEDKNTETQRTQSFASRLSSVSSASLCFKKASRVQGEEY